jgi:hypothetical protein
VEERGEEREEQQAVSLQSTWTKEPKNFVREISESCISSEELTTIWVG